MQKRVVPTLLVLIVAATALFGCSSPVGEKHSMAFDQPTSEYQNKMLEDGQISAAEYEKSFLDYRDCVIAVGADPGETVDLGNQLKGFEYELNAADDEELAALETKADKCLTEYYDVVSQSWANQHLATDEEREALRPKVISCLREKGFALTDNSSSEQIAALPIDESNAAGFNACSRQYPEFFTVLPNKDEHEH